MSFENQARISVSEILRREIHIPGLPNYDDIDDYTYTIPLYECACRFVDNKTHINTRTSA